MIWDSVTGIIDKILEKLSPEERKRRLKDEIDKLETERNTILIFKCDDKKAERLIWIHNRLITLNRLLRNYS